MRAYEDTFETVQASKWNGSYVANTLATRVQPHAVTKFWPEPNNDLIIDYIAHFNELNMSECQQKFIRTANKKLESQRSTSWGPAKISRVSRHFKFNLRLQK